jgi:multidrug transporter EmrE-like cation transporter
MAGLFAGIAEIFYLFMYTKDAPLNIGTPLVVGLTIVVAVLLGVIILKESLDINKVIGICLTIIGLLFLMKN